MRFRSGRLYPQKGADLTALGKGPESNMIGIELTQSSTQAASDYSAGEGSSLPVSSEGPADALSSLRCFFSAFFFCFSSSLRRFSPE